MTLKELEKRVRALETELAQLRSQVTDQPPLTRSWLDLAGKYADDPTYDEFVRIMEEARAEDRRRTLEELDREV